MSRPADVTGVTETRQITPREAELVLVVMGPSGPTTFPLPSEGDVIVGRAHDAFVRIDDPSVSRHHVSLCIGEHTTIRDLGSKNGTKVAGVALAPETDEPVGSGSLIEIGDVTVLLQPRRDTELSQRPTPAADDDTDAPRPEVDGIVRGHAMQKIHAIVKRVAPDDISVLLLGETGVGKEVMAETLHHLSHRRKGPLVRLHCAAVSETLFESELFGHEKGSFTGATTSRPGLLETADGGTAFIDEVGELPPSIQVKLLRVLEDRAVRRVGGRTSTPIDVRFVAATNRDLEREVAEGRFRQDLYFRLSGFTIRIPSLRERADEIEPLVREFVKRACEERKRTPPTIDPRVIETLKSYPWPGNIRELKNIVVRALLVCPGDRLEVEHLPLDEMLSRRRTMVGSSHAIGGGASASAMPVAPPPSSPGFTVPSAPGSSPPPPPGPITNERERILAALDQCAGNQTKAAKLLGISRRTLITRLEEYGIPRPRK